jgi:hypothetical protein
MRSASNSWRTLTGWLKIDLPLLPPMQPRQCRAASQPILAMKHDGRYWPPPEPQFTCTWFSIKPKGEWRISILPLAELCSAAFSR